MGIGGIGMSGIAELLLNLGYEVTGSDLKEGSTIERLRQLGARISIGHREENLSDPDVVVYSSAVPLDNPEILAAQDKGIPVIKRAEILAELMRLKYGIAIAGAHGKTTTTSMVASVLTKAGLDPTVVIGGRLNVWGGANYRLGEGDILVAEADESDGSFLHLFPILAVVTNIDREHMDFYRSMETLRDTFVQFLNNLPFYGKGFLCLDDEEVQLILPRVNRKVVTYGLSQQADLRGSSIRKEGAKVSFEATFHGQPLGRIEVGVPGEHNVRNALAAVGIGLELGLSIDVIRAGLQDLGGLARRFQIKGEKKGIVFVDDYGHHPTEIHTVLKTAKEVWPFRRLVVLFQPHRYTRTRDLAERFAVSFYYSDLLVVFPIYPAGESPIDGVDHHNLAREIKSHGHKDVFVQDAMEAQLVLPLLRQGDVVLTLGAGDIFRLGEELIESI